MIYFIILLVFIVLPIVIFQMILKGFKNPQRKHNKTPDSFGVDFEEVSIPTNNNRKLYGWLMSKNPSLSTIILMHGWGRNVERMMPYIEQLSKLDFNLLAFDARHHGNSDDDDHSTMKKFAEDIQSSIRFIQNNTKITNEAFGLVGLSIGGAASIYAAAHEAKIKSVITVGAFADPYEIMRAQMASYRIPFNPVGKFIFWYLERKVGFKFHDIAPEKHISKSGARFFLIHGEDDKTIPIDHVHRLESAARKENVKTWKIPGRGHSDCHFENSYWPNITRFLTESIP